MKRQWETEELVEHWTLDVEDRALLGNKTGVTRLGFAVLLKFFRREGRFPQYKNEVPALVVTYLSTQVGVDASAYMQYAWQGRTIEYHRAQIREALGFRESSVADGEQMQQRLITEVLPQEHQDERLREQAYAWFRRRHLEAPTPDRLTRLIRSAAHTFEQEYLNEFKRVGNKEGILYQIAEAAVAHPDEPVREVVFPVASEKLLREVIKEYKAKSPAFRKQVHLIMRASYSHHYRRMVPELLEILDFRSNNELYRPVIRALQLVKDYVHSPRQYYPDHESIPIKEVVAPTWREFVVEQDDDGASRVNRLNYEVCTLQALREKVRVREIWISGANRYRDPDDDLPTDFSQKRATYYEALHQPTEADVFIEKLKEDMRKALHSLDGAMPRIRDKVRLLRNRKKKPISITRSEERRVGKECR